MNEANEEKVKIRLEGVSVADAGEGLRTLREDILDAERAVQADIIQDEPTNQDFGTTLVLVLGAPAAIAVAKGIQAWLTREGGKATLTINGVKYKRKSADAAKIAQ